MDFTPLSQTWASVESHANGASRASAGIPAKSKGIPITLTRRGRRRTTKAKVLKGGQEHQQKAKAKGNGCLCRQAEGRPRCRSTLVFEMTEEKGKHIATLNITGLTTD